MSGDPADLALARQMLEPAVYAGTAPIEDMRLLESICRRQHASACVKAVKHRMAGR